MVIVVVLVTGFAAPGFILSHDREAAPAPDTTTQSPTETSTPSSFSRNGDSQLQAAKTVTEEFLRRLNADVIEGADGAKAMACPDSESLLGGTVMLAVEAPTQLAIPADGEVRFHDPVIEVDVTGTTHKRAVTGYVRLQPWQDHQPCVRILQLKPS
ncbi:hypothetical protein [Amycolatopsis sp. cmx-4-83]|uniref:hypothetical protein n=1 Tax=Amycolatopsis sp. cmx-4-83 TaxID=2790940 RepID=UPI00397920B7